MPVDALFVQGVLKIANVFLSIVAAVFCIKLFIITRSNKEIEAWGPLAIALLIFAFGEAMGTLDAFGFLYFRPYLTLIEVGVVSFLVIALIFKLRQVKTRKQNKKIK